MTNSGLLLRNDKRGVQDRSDCGRCGNAEKAIFAFEQQQHFTLDIALLERGKHCREDSLILNMNPILDQDVLRVGGRINRSTTLVSVSEIIIN